MSQLEKPFINSNGRCRVKLNARQKRAVEEHEKWLRSQGLHPDQLKKRSRVSEKPVSPPISERKIPELSHGVGNGFVKSIFETARKESPKVQEEILRKAQRVESLYSKGPLQYVTPGTDTTMLGSKSRRG